MANTASRWLDACNALTFGMRARAGYRSPVDASDAIPVYHSIEIGMHSAGNVERLLVIGWPGDPETPIEPGQSGQSVATLGTTRHRQETGSINCRVIVQTGDCELSGLDPVATGTAPWLLGRAFAILDDVDAFVRSDPSLGLGGATVAYIDGLPSVRPATFETGGMTAEVDFGVHFGARI